LGLLTHPLQTEGKRNIERKIDYYNLDMIISVGYRVKSNRGIQFRIWANKILKEYLIKGYAINQRAKAEQLEEMYEKKRQPGAVRNLFPRNFFKGIPAHLSVF
jgi:hypothetical protein